MSFITRIEIENFMRIGHAVLEFDDTNIINLVGYNDSGKSAITRAIEVVLYDNYSNDQVNFIKDGEDYFKVTLTFSDGVVITKEKHINGKSVWEMVVNGEVVFTNNVNGNIVAVYNVPDVIAKYLGVVEDEITNEKLNVRRRSDKLFLIETSGGDNYKILNSVLKVDVLSDAFKRMNEDKNKLMSELSALGVQRDTIKNEFDSIKLVEDKDELELKSLLDTVKEVKSRYDNFKKVVDLYNLKESIYVFEELLELNTDRFSSLINILSLQKDKNMVVWDEEVEINTDRLKELYSMLDLHKDTDIYVYDNLDVIDVNRFNVLLELVNLMMLKDMYVYDSLGELDLGKLDILGKVWHSYNQYKTIEKEFVSIENDLNSDKNMLRDMANELNVKICENCGSVVM